MYISPLVRLPKSFVPNQNQEIPNNITYEEINIGIGLIPKISLKKHATNKDVTVISLNSTILAFSLASPRVLSQFLSHEYSEFYKKYFKMKKEKEE